MLRVEPIMDKYFTEVDALSEQCPMTKDGNDKFEKGVEYLKGKYEKLYPEYFKDDAGVNMINICDFLKKRRSSKFNVGDYVYFEKFWKWDESGQHTSVNMIHGVFLGKVTALPEEEYGDTTYTVERLYVTDKLYYFIQPCDMRKLNKAEIKTLS